MKIRLYYLAVLLLATACQKENAKTEYKELQTSKIASKNERIMLSQPFNPANPADSIGIIHNESLSYVYKKLCKGKNFSDDLKMKYLVEFFEKRYGGDLLKSIEERDERYSRYDHIPILELTEKMPCSEVIAGSVNSILVAAYAIKSPAGYNSFKKKVVDIENKVLKGELKMSRTEADQLLHFSSIVRHSMWFWMDTVSKNQDVNETEFLRRFLKGLLGGLADAHGALVSLLTYASFRNVLEDAALDSAMMLWAFGL